MTLRDRPLVRPFATVSVVIFLFASKNVPFATFCRIYKRPRMEYMFRGNGPARRPRATQNGEGRGRERGTDILPQQPCSKPSLEPRWRQQRCRFSRPSSTPAEHERGKGRRACMRAPTFSHVPSRSRASRARAYEQGLPTN